MFAEYVHFAHILTKYCRMFSGLRVNKDAVLSNCTNMISVDT